MTYVVTDACIDVKDGSCVEVCPVDCIHPTPDEPDFATVQQLYIDGDVCVDCNICAVTCPVGAIFADRDLPSPLAAALDVNAAYYRPAAQPR